MEENIFATERNGHPLVNLYDPKTNTLDIRSNGLYPSNVLSNLFANEFCFDGVACQSMEGFLQSLKHADADKQLQLCGMKGGSARKHSSAAWQASQTVWWKGEAIGRQSETFRQLIRRAYQALFDQNVQFRDALLHTRGITLTHTTGVKDPTKTILTPDELCRVLMEIRDCH